MSNRFVYAMLDTFHKIVVLVVSNRAILKALDMWTRQYKDRRQCPMSRRREDPTMTFSPSHLDDMVLSCLVAIACQHAVPAAIGYLLTADRRRYMAREQAILSGEKEHESELRCAWWEGVDGRRVTLSGHPVFELRRC